MDLRSKDGGYRRPDGQVRVTGVAIQYAVACERELWFYLHGIETNNEDQNILIGRQIDSEYYRRLRRQVMIDGSVRIDVIKRRGKEITVLETKKSRKLVEPGKWQLLYYLYVLKKHGVDAEGYLAIPTERKRVRVVLTEYAERKIEALMKNVERVAQMPSPPPPVRKPYCKGCAYRELCWV